MRAEHAGSRLMVFRRGMRIHFYVELDGKFAEFHSMHELKWFEKIWYAGRIRYIGRENRMFNIYTKGIWVI